MKPLIAGILVLIALAFAVAGAPKRETPMIEEYAECVARWNQPGLCSEMIIQSRRNK